MAAKNTVGMASIHTWKICIYTSMHFYHITVRVWPEDTHHKAGKTSAIRRWQTLSKSEEESYIHVNLLDLVTKNNTNIWKAKQHSNTFMPQMSQWSLYSEPDADVAHGTWFWEWRMCRVQSVLFSTHFILTLLQYKCKTNQEQVNM